MVFGFVELNMYVILSFLTTFLLINLGLIVLLGNKKMYAKAFASGCFFAALWSFAGALYLGATISYSPIATFFFENIQRFTYYTGLLVILSFFYFSYRFPHTKDRSSKVFWTLITFAILVFPIFAFTDLIIAGYGGWTNPSGEFTRPAIIALHGPLRHLYTLVFTGFIISAIAIIHHKVLTEKNASTKKHLRFMFWSLIVGFIPATIFNVILPGINITSYTNTFLGIISSNIWAIFVAYTIIKYNQMDVRFVTTELLVILVIFLLFIAIFV